MATQAAASIGDSWPSPAEYVDEEAAYAEYDEQPQEEEHEAASSHGSSSYKIRIWYDNMWGYIWPNVISDEGDAWGWDYSRGWFRFQRCLGTGIPNFISEDHPRWAGNRRTSGTDISGYKDRDGDVPEWDGTTLRSVYFRKIDLWAVTTGVPPEKRALRLLQKLTGHAFDKTEHLDPASLLVTDGIKMFKDHLEKIFEPIEDFRVGKIMDEFLDDFSRKKDQEIVDFNIKWTTELAKVEKIAGDLNPKWKAHLYLRKLRVNTTQKAQIHTVTLGNYTVEALQKAAMTCIPSVKEAFSSRDTRTSHYSRGGKKSFGIKKTFKGRKGFRRPPA